MLFKALSLLLTIGAALAATPMDARINSDSSLMELMMMPRAADPQTQQYCFNRYIPILKKITDDYETEYKGCQTTYDDKCITIDYGYTKLRQNVTATSKQSCQSLQQCDSIGSYIEAFECFGKTAYEQSNNLSYLSGQSVKASASIKEEYTTAALVRDDCFIVSYNKYTDNSVKTNDDLKECLDGNIPPNSQKIPTF